MLKKMANNKGFTLTEVMIGIMILTMAIVSASNLLIDMIRSNRNNVLTLQAYYLAQEGVEAVRNIRDTNWLHNSNFKGNDQGVFPELVVGKFYSITLKEGGWASSSSEGNLGVNDLKTRFAPWQVTSSGDRDLYSSTYALEVKGGENGPNYYAEANVAGDDTDVVFYRHIEILEAPSCRDANGAENPDVCDNFILARSVVNWHDGSQEHQLYLDTLLSNWKGGAL